MKLLIVVTTLVTLALTANVSSGPIDNKDPQSPDDILLIEDNVILIDPIPNFQEPIPVNILEVKAFVQNLLIGLGNRLTHLVDAVNKGNLNDFLPPDYPLPLEPNSANDVQIVKHFVQEIINAVENTLISIVDSVYEGQNYEMPPFIVNEPSNAEEIQPVVV